MVLTDDEIINSVLSKLDRWVLDTSIISDDLTDMDYNKSIKREEILTTYNDIIEYALSYINRSDANDVPVFDTALIYWTAGALYQKYNTQINSNIDETNVNPFGYGDRLIIQAKEMLKPFKSYSFVTF